MGFGGLHPLFRRLHSPIVLEDLCARYRAILVARLFTVPYHVGILSAYEAPDWPVPMMSTHQMDPPNWQALLRRHDIRPSKSLGQHFMLADGAISKVVDAAELGGDETVLEIGAGIGALTVNLARAAKRVVAVEIDSRLLPALNEVVGKLPEVLIVHGDILKLDLEALVGVGPYCVVANIPYNITSMLIRRLLEAAKNPDRIVLTVQREVAERIVATPGQMSLLALSVALYGTPRIMARIQAGSFYPPPKVDSAVLRVDLHAQALMPVAMIPTFFRIARAGFQQKRKQLRNALSSGLQVPAQQVVFWLEEAGISPQSRAQELGLDDWARLVDVYAKGAG
jgi:16S rRNA (adenine1518-N6/adenine1519-N6)-dimethyltransferase